MLRYFGLDPSKNWTKEELIQYDNSLIAKQDKRQELIAVYKEGLEEIKKEYTEYMTIAIIECWKIGTTPEILAIAFDLPIEEIQRIIQNHKDKA